MSEEGFGKDKQGTGEGGKYAKRLKLKPGSNIFRIIPPIKSLSEPGIWYKFYKQHFGYMIPGISKVPGTEFFLPAPWECLEERNRSDMIVVSCPECKLVEAKKELIDSREAESKGLDANTAAAFLGPLKAWTKAHNLDKKYYINAKMQNGDFGFLPLPWTAYKALKDRKAKVEAAEKISAIDADQGVWFEVTRTGEGLTTSYTCDVVMEGVEYNGRIMQCVKPAPLSKGDFASAMKDCADLATEVIRHISMEQASALVSMEDGGGADPEAVAHILNVGTRRGRGERSPEPKAAVEKPVEKPVAVPVVKFEKPAPKPPEPIQELPPPPVEEDEEAALVAALAAARAAKAARAAAAAKPDVAKQAEQAVAKATVEAASGFKKTGTATMSDEDFLSVFGDPTKKQ